MGKPRVFIGSSKESLRIAEAVFAGLVQYTEPTIWTHQLSLPGRHPLEVLEKEIRRHSFAILVASPDDQVIKRGTSYPSIRDNILIEFGLFTGALGRRRTFFVCPDQPRIELPSDLLGIIYATYDSDRIKGDLDDIAAAVQVACTQIRQVIKEEWELNQKQEQEARDRLRSSKGAQAIRRLHNVAIHLRDALMTIQRDAFAAFSDEQAFEEIKRKAAPKIKEIAESFKPDANIIGVETELECLADVTISALLDLPFPRELAVGREEAGRAALNLGLEALGTFLQGGDPMRHVSEVSLDEVRARLLSLRERYAEWWDRHYPKLQEAAARMQDALLHAAMQLATTTEHE